MRAKQIAAIAVLSALSIFGLAACDSGTPSTPTAPANPPTVTVTPTQGLPNVPSETPTTQANGPTPTSQAQATPTRDPFGAWVSVSRDEYEAAVAKWKAADVREYEILANFGSPTSDVNGNWLLRVRDDKIVQIWRGDVEVYIDDNGRSIPNPEANPGTLNFLTVQAQFDDIKELLDDPSKLYVEISGDKYEVQFDVKLNDELGYPEHFYSNPVRITDSSEARSIWQIRILEQGPNATVDVTPAPPLESPTPRPRATATGTSEPVEPTAGPTQEVVIEKFNPDSSAAYVDAKNKWEAAGISEYEIEATIAGEGIETSWDLRVKDGKVTILDSSEGIEATEDDYGIVLPDKQFAMMADVIAGNDSTGVVIDGQEFVITYVVEFDPDLGYPHRFEMRAKPGPAMDMGYVVTVTDFKVIK